MQIFWKTLWPKRERVSKEPDFTILYPISKLETPKKTVCDPERSWPFWIQRWKYFKCANSRISSSHSLDCSKKMYWLASHERPSTVFHRSVFWRCRRTSITGSTFQIFHGDVKILKNNRNKRLFVIESDEDDWLYSYFFSFQLISTAAFSCSIITDARNIYIFLRSTKFFGKKKTKQPVAAGIFDKFRHKPFLNSCSVFLRCSRHQ